MREKRYRLEGFVIVTTWYGNRGWATLRIYTDEKGLKEIKKEPLQDYLSFGVQSVDYVYFDVYQSEIITENKKRITIEELEPVEVIEKGKYKLTEKEEKLLIENPNVVEIYY